jgi:DNA mismatch repair protein MutS2
MQELLQSKAKMLNENLIVMRNGRMCLCVKAEYKNVLKGVIHDESASKTTVYIEPFSALEIANRIVSYKEEEKTEIAKILAQLSNVAFSYELEIKNNFNNLIALDIIFAKALYAISIDAYKPSINEMGIIDIKKARHPLIDRQKCVPIDIKLGEDYEAIIITGPNTGGKTVAIKTCGLLTLMMQAGLLIPASFDSKMAVFDNVFSDIGDEQSIEQSLSSFSAHMTKVIKILNELTNNSLVLLDELGSGTDPKEGSNLAISIVEYLLNKKSRVIVTTHYADLKAFAYDKDNIINASVEFDTKTLRPTYKLLLGVPGRSNAITIARGLGLNEEIINRSIELNETNHTDLSLMLSKLDDQNSILSEQIAKYEKENLALNDRLAKLQAKELKLEAEYASFINKAKKEANEIIVKAQEDALALISEIEKKHENFKEHELAELKHQARQLEVIDVDTPTITDFKVGDEVFVKGWQRNGKITKINKDKYEVLVGNFTVTFTKNELSVAKTVTKPVTKPKKYNAPGPVKKEAKLECDLRGFRYEEVAPELDLFIDKAYLAGLSQIYVIHGFGTGAVRKACYEFFKKCPHVKSTRFGGEGEGLNGVTVVYLK